MTTLGVCIECDTRSLFTVPDVSGSGHLVYVRFCIRCGFRSWFDPQVDAKDEEVCGVA